MYKAVEPFIEAAAYIVDGACLSMLFAKFGVKRIQRGIWTCILTILAWSAANMLIRYFVFSDLPYTLEKSLISFLLHSAAIYLIGLGLYSGRQVIRLFLTLLFIALLYVISEVGHGIRLFLVDGVEKLSMRHEAFQNITTVKIILDSIYIFIDIAAVALFYFSIKSIVNNHRRPAESRSAKEFIFGILPALLGSLVSVALYFMILLINEQGHI
ncbi:MAG: hypothetical protein HFH14_04255, partial [Lachnospiraceae bacterium]|nr:hypothetical protein [Lachnospiraceae bacterium]